MNTRTGPYFSDRDNQISALALRVGSFEEWDFNEWFKRRGFRIRTKEKSNRQCIRCGRAFGYYLKRGMVDRRTCRKCIQLPSYRTAQADGH